MSIPVVYEDDWLLVLDKPAGLLVIPSPKNESLTLTGILNTEAKNQGKPYRLHPCHRLDRETSGLIIYAKGKSIQGKMMQEFKQRKVKKTYIAFVQGAIPKDQGVVNNRIEGISAITGFKVLQRKGNFTVLEVSPVTGRTNQIRIHFKQIGHPVVGESKFAFRKDFALKAKRLCLHAKELRFEHPVTANTVYLKAELPEAMESFLLKSG